jgi:hypothetical protein
VSPSTDRKRPSPLWPPIKMRKSKRKKRRKRKKKQ